MTDLLGSTSTAGSGGSFPQTASALGSFNSNAVLALSPAQFAADYDVSSTQLAAFVDPSTGKLNSNAAYLGWYYSLTQGERQSIQSAMVNAGQLSSADATGLNNSTALGAFKSLIGTTAAQGTNVISYLDQLGQGTNAIQNQISSNLTKDQEAATQPIVATETNPNTLEADLTNAFDNALGYAPDAKQIQSFISQVQGQETSYAEAPRTEAQDEINQAHSEENALNKLGPEGIDTVIQAYQAAVTGTKLPGAGTPQGPVNGAIPAPGTPIGSPLQPGTVPTMNAQGTVVGGQVENTTSNKYVNQSPGLVDQALHGFLNPQPDTEKLVTTHGTKVEKNPPLPAGTPNTTPTYGGTYALSPADWKKAQSLYSAASKYSTAGSAPQSVQLGAFTSLLTNAYDESGSWSKAVASIASGSPFGTSEGTHLSAFGTSVANEVNNQITALQNQVNNSAVTVKVAAPDSSGAYGAEAANAAKEADPVGYYAANTASWGQELNQMLAGAPLMYSENTSDSFSGPVTPGEASSTPASAPVSSAAPSPNGGG